MSGMGWGLGFPLHVKDTETRGGFSYMRASKKVSLTRLKSVYKVEMYKKTFQIGVKHPCKGLQMPEAIISNSTSSRDSLEFNDQGS